jgi:hypothetical protein
VWGPLQPLLVNHPPHFTIDTFYHCLPDTQFARLMLGATTHRLHLQVIQPLHQHIPSLTCRHAASAALYARCSAGCRWNLGTLSLVTPPSAPLTTDR